MTGSKSPSRTGRRPPSHTSWRDDSQAEVLAFTAFPRAHWRKIWSTNPLERVNKEIKRRSRVVGISPISAYDLMCRCWYGLTCRSVPAS